MSDNIDSIQKYILQIDSVKMNYDIAEKNSNAPEKFYSLLSLGKLYYENADNTKALITFREATNLLNGSDIEINNKEEGDLYLHLGNAELVNGNYREALNTLNYCLDIVNKNDILDLKFEVLRKIGNVFYFLGDYSKSLEFYYKSLHEAEVIGNNKGIAAAYNNIAANLSRFNKKYKAIEVYEKVRSLAQKNNDYSLYATASNNIGYVYSQKNQHKKSLEYYKVALKYSKNNKEKSQYYSNVATEYLALKDYEKAYNNYYKSFEYTKKLGSYNSLGLRYSDFVNFFIETNQFDSAESYIEKTKIVLDSIENSVLKKEYYMIKYSFYEKKNNYKEALSYYKKYRDFSDSLSGADVKKKIANLNAVYQAQNSQQQLKILQEKQNKLHLMTLVVIVIVLFVLFVVIYFFYVLREKNKRLFTLNTKMRSQQSTLEERNKELNETAKKLEDVIGDRNKLFSIISHDLRSPFNSLIGFSEMLIDEVKAKDIDQESVSMMSDNIYKSSMRLFELMQNLLEWSNSERGKVVYSPEKIFLNKIVEDNILLARYTANIKNIVIKNNVSASHIVMADYNMLNTIIRNLLFNAIKFTPKNNAISIFSEITNRNTVNIIVDDTGVGMTKVEIDTILSTESSFSNAGTENEKGVGLGLLLVKEFVNKHNSKLVIISEKNIGSSFSFELKQG